VALLLEGGAVRVVLPTDREHTIGRDPTSDVVLASHEVSRHHARIRPLDHGWLLLDDGSANGTYVGDGERVDGNGVALSSTTPVRFADEAGEIVFTDSASRADGGTSRPQVFVSYSRRDASKVDAIVSSLDRHGIDAWVDRSKLVGSSDWTAEITRAIRTSDAVVVVLSRAAVQSDDVANEVNLAGEHERPLFPVLLERVEIPDDLAYHLAGRQRFVLDGDDRTVQLDRLAEAIKAPRIRYRDKITVGRRVAIAALVILVLIGVPTAALAVLTGSFPPDLGRITGSASCDGLQVEVRTEDVTNGFGPKTAHVAVVLTNSSSTAIDATDWSVRLTAVGGERYEFLQRNGIDATSIAPGGQATGRVDVEGDFAPASGDVPVHAVVSHLHQGDAVFSKCSGSGDGVISWG
jgi:hypothetical protein